MAAKKNIVNKSKTIPLTPSFFIVFTSLTLADTLQNAFNISSTGITPGQTLGIKKALMAATLGKKAMKIPVMGERGCFLSGIFEGVGMDSSGMANSLVARCS